MKTKFAKEIMITLALLSGMECAYSQGTFQNLDFESPDPSLALGGPALVPISGAMPGWNGYIGGTQIDTVAYNTISLGGAAISLQGPGSLEPILQGSYTVFLQPDYNSGGGAIPNSVAIAQTGQIPLTARSLEFFAYFSGLQVTFGGQSLPILDLGTGPNYTIYGVDVSAFAGQTGELRFTCPPVQPSGFGGARLDAIEFSSQSVPEPDEAALLAGALGLWWCSAQRKLRVPAPQAISKENQPITLRAQGSSWGAPGPEN
jgi:hypothetical protein